MTDRIKAILSAGDSAGLPEIARVLALDTTLEAEAAALVFAGAAKDIATATASAGQTIIAPPSGGATSSTGSFNTLGVPDRIGGDAKADVKATWAKAVAQANRGFEVAGI